MLPRCFFTVGMLRHSRWAAQRQADEPGPPSQVLVTVWDEQSRLDALRMAAEMREKGIAVETYLGSDAIGKQIRYASNRGLPYVVVQGPDEKAAGIASIKNLVTGVQTSVPGTDVASYVAQTLGV